MARERQQRHQAARRAIQRDERRTRHQAKRRRRRWIYLGASGIIAFLVIVSLFLPQLPQGGGSSKTDLTSGPGEEFPSLPASHIQAGVTYDGYSSVPPTSGPHWDAPAQWGIYTEPVRDEQQVHNLEHGGVIIQYNTQDEALIAQLEAFAEKQPSFPCWLIVAPYPDMEFAIALTAWPGIPAPPPAEPTYLPGVRDTMEAYDEARLQAFLDFYRNQGPERVACTPTP